VRSVERCQVLCDAELDALGGFEAAINFLPVRRGLKPRPFKTESLMEVSAATEFFRGLT
jgi:hypothetical protein